MSKDYVMWDIEEILKAYSEEPEMGAGVKVKLEALFLFLEANNLLRVKVSNEEGQVIRRKISKSELTEEGCALGSGPKNPVQKWLGSKASQKSPPDMKALEKELASIRAGK